MSTAVEYVTETIETAQLLFLFVPFRFKASVLWRNYPMLVRMLYFEGFPGQICNESGSYGELCCSFS